MEHTAGGGGADALELGCLFQFNYQERIPARRDATVRVIVLYTYVQYLSSPFLEAIAGMWRARIADSAKQTAREGGATINRSDTVFSPGLLAGRTAWQLHPLKWISFYTA